MSYIKGNVKVLLFLGLVIILVIALFFVLKIQREARALNESAAGDALGATQSEITYTDIDGNPVKLSDYLGRVLVVNSWASWSPFSAEELMGLSTVINEFDSTKVKVLAINRAEPGNTAQRYLKTVGATDNIFLILDPADNFYKSINGYAMPETVFFDKTGKIIFQSHGPLKTDEIRAYINTALDSN